MKLYYNIRSLLLITTVVLFSACATYHQKTIDFNNNFASGNIEQANKILSKDKKAEKRKTKLLYYLNKGVVEQMLGNYTVSNEFFEKAYLTSEDYQRNYVNEAVSFLSNPNFITYNGESHELLLIHYYKALNFIKMNQFEEALVEIKRTEVKLNKLEDKYKSKNKYTKDAFLNLLMGMIYDAKNDYNNAFIAYRNAYNIYKDEYKSMFGFTIPEQLKNDMLRAAYRTGFMDEVSFYEKELNYKYVHNVNPSNGEVVFLWQNGIGPYKDEWSINFTIVKGQGGVLTFVNEEYGINFSFPASSYDNNTNFSDFKFIRVAFPKYVEKPQYYTSATIETNQGSFNLNLAENINAVAFKSLNDRMLLELGKGVLRLALKQAAEQQVRKQNQNAGTAVSIFNAITEKADTRNWQTLPHSIYYTRISLPEGKHDLKLKVQSSNGKTKEITIAVDVKAKQTSFYNFHTLESLPSMQ